MLMAGCVVASFSADLSMDICVQGVPRTEAQKEALRAAATGRVKTEGQQAATSCLPRIASPTGPAWTTLFSHTMFLLYTCAYGVGSQSVRSCALSACLLYPHTSTCCFTCLPQLGPLRLVTMHIHIMCK